MTTYVAFSEVEAADIVNSNVAVLTAGTAIEAGVNRAAIQLSSQAIFLTTLETPINEGWFHARVVPRNGTADAYVVIDYMMSIVDENDNIIAGFYDNKNSTGGSSHTPSVRAVMFSDTGIGSQNLNTTGVLVVANPTESAYHFDMYFKIGNSGGIIRWYVNGVMVREFLGDTQNGASNLIKKIRFRALGRNDDTGNDHTLRFAQVLVSDLPTINARVHTIPLSAGSVTEWTGSVSDINGSEISPATVMTEATIGDALIMATTDSAASILTGNEIRDVIISSSALHVAGSLVNGLTGKVKIGGTEYDGDPKSLTSGFKLTQHMFSLNPATSAQWTISDINGAELGIETVS